MLKKSSDETFYIFQDVEFYHYKGKHEKFDLWHYPKTLEEGQ